MHRPVALDIFTRTTAPHPSHGSADATAPAAAIARAVDAILATLLDLLWLRARYVRALGRLHPIVWNRISNTRARLARALAYLAAGRRPRARPRATPRSGAPAPFPHARHFGWLGHLLDHDIRGIASQLRHLLAQPGVADTLAASPGAARTLRPLCHMLGVALPAPLHRARRPRPKPAQTEPAQPEPAQATPAPPPAPPPPDPPIPGYVLRAARAWKLPHERTRRRPAHQPPPPEPA